MKNLKFLPLAFVVTIAATSNTAFAQRERASRDDRRQQRQQENANLTPQQRQQNFQARMQERMNSMSPAQRQQMQERIAGIQQQMTDAGIDMNDPDALQKARDAGLLNGMGAQGGGNAAADAMKQMMNAAGITEADTQNAIIVYVDEQNKARLTLLDLAKKAASALQAPAAQPINAADTGTEETADAKVVTTFSAYEDAVKVENDRQEKALKELDAKINYSGTPRIKSFLTLVGILNNDALALGGPAAIFATPRQNNRGGQSQNGGQTNRGQGQNNGG